MIKREINLPGRKSFFLFGPRLTGKSTLLNAEYGFHGKEVLYLDLLDTDNLHQYMTEPAALYREVSAAWPQKKIIILDEVQKVPILLNEVHRLMEAYPAIQFILSGSSARKLKRMHSDLLGGRALTRNLHPLTIAELGAKFDLTKALEFGTLPAIYLEKEREVANDMLRSYVETYLNEEVKQESLVRNLGAFLKFLPLSGEESGNILNFSNLSREIGVSYKTIQEYFQILSDTLLAYFLPAYAKSKRSSLIQHPKFYYFDTGVLRAIRKELTLPLKRNTSLFGRYFEHFIINELRRQNDYQKLDCSFYHFRTFGGQEVDLVIEKPGKKVAAIEIKAKERLGAEDFKGLRVFKEYFPKADLFLIALVPRPQKFDDILVVPWREFQIQSEVRVI